MLASAMNFAIGFFGYPFDGQYQQSITVEADGVRSSNVNFVVQPFTFLPYQFNNTLAPYKTCVLYASWSLTQLIISIYLQLSKCWY